MHIYYVDYGYVMNLLDLQVEEVLCLVCNELFGNILGIELDEKAEGNGKNARHILHKHLWKKKNHAIKYDNSQWLLIHQESFLMTTTNNNNKLRLTWDNKQKHEARKNEK